MNSFGVFEKGRLVKWDSVGIPSTGKIAAAYINLATFKEGASIDGIIGNIIIVKYKCLDRLDPAAVVELRQDHIVQEDVVLGLKGTHGCVEQVGINREKFTVRW